MARIDALPSLEIIRGLKGILDFYMWKGLPCVRAWPTYRPAKQTAASLAAALVFGAIVKSYGLLGDLPLEAYREDARDQTRTARDIMVTGIYGNLHEASMSDFLDALIVSRDALVALTALLEALHSVDTDQIVARIEHSVIPDGAATAAAQATQLTALQKIDDLQDALQSKGLDRLIVRGEDQLFSYNGELYEPQYTADAPGPDHLFNFPSPPDGQVWVITNTSVVNATRAYGRCNFLLWDGTNGYDYYGKLTPAQHEMVNWKGIIPIEHGRNIRVTTFGGQAGDAIYSFIHGYKMTKET